MPELPEVETVVRGLQKPLTGQRIILLDQRRPNLRIPFPAHLKSRVEDTVIKNIYRRAKYILMDLSSDETLILHLGMSGRMTVFDAAQDERQKHDHLVFQTNDGYEVAFNDARRFGMVDLHPTAEIDTHKFFAHLGPEPLSNHFSPAYLMEKFQTKKTAVKVALLDQQIVVGIGNCFTSFVILISLGMP